jgi:transposase
MQHITGIPRNQMVFSSLEHNFTIILFVLWTLLDALSLVALGFKIQTLKEGRPSFDTKVFLKIYLYGYLNGVQKL